MPLSHDDVTATVTVTGLALGCYNPSTQNWEVGFIRHERHILTIEVIKQTGWRGRSRMKFELDDEHRIFINTENAIAPDTPIYTVGEEFDRQDDTHDPEDFRWVVDLEKELNGNSQVQLRHPTVPVTEMYVSKPRLYADAGRLAIDPYVLVDTENPGPQGTREFGLLTEGAKADIRCRPGGAVILRVEGPQGFQIHLPHGSEPHLIHVDNTCPETGTEDESDFVLYYSVVQSTNQTKYDFRPENDGGHGEGAVCNKVFLGSRDSLFPLP